jgi:hypothetical protein
MVNSSFSSTLEKIWCCSFAESWFSSNFPSSAFLIEGVLKFWRVRLAIFLISVPPAGAAGLAGCCAT